MDWYYITLHCAQRKADEDVLTLIVMPEALKQDLGAQYHSLMDFYSLHISPTQIMGYVQTLITNP